MCLFMVPHFAPIRVDQGNRKGPPRQSRRARNCRCSVGRQTCWCAVLVTKHVQPSIDLFLTEQAGAKIGGDAFHVPPVECTAHNPATGIDVEIRGALNCSKETMASYDGGAQEFITGCEAEVDP